MFFVYVQDNKARIPIKNITNFINTHKQPTDVTIAFEDPYNKLVIPTIAKIYELALNLHNESLTLIPSYGLVPDDKTIEYEEFEFEPYNSNRVNIVAVGGTFDKLHYGHKLLLTATALYAKNKVICGVSTNVAKKEFAEKIEPLHKRIANTSEMIFKINPSVILQIEAITDVAGPVGRPGDLDLLVVSKETTSGAQAVEELRKEKNLPPIDIVSIPLITENGERLSSTMLRSRQAIDQN
ncbi:Cytidylyltransferase family protein [Trichomonas vaginalis G3]|uniref:Cytidylyltransferase family protein n=1 Tax=Trichomonas vaginalis (strain ATCC PRA-98 / G3) TaxID=412133 RepID=A2EH29_TRIV3|nr:coenzyme A synthase family [Trichomonas vaginalis G3]EAY08077.1 Cytidylyltransferase family protein [Trichomonas vaginalis G3]KAI5543006.1 coenzyme A synthase family [Trichomonas vaginalis G3]|eukprot:XP_001320300.1 Cytidylyltransferase family protein [Trichomonas vaginalis G3]